MFKICVYVCVPLMHAGGVQDGVQRHANGAVVNEEVFVNICMLIFQHDINKT